MDFSFLVKTIYEMDAVLVSENICGCQSKAPIRRIGRVEEYEKGIEILFEDDYSLHIDKEIVYDVVYTPTSVRIVFNNGGYVLIENV